MSKYARMLMAALDGADGVVILTEWNEFRALDLKTAKRMLKAPPMADLRNTYRIQRRASLMSAEDGHRWGDTTRSPLKIARDIVACEPFGKMRLPMAFFYKTGRNQNQHDDLAIMPMQDCLR